MICVCFLPECVQDHGEEDKLAEEGNHEGGRGDDLSQEEEEHGQREKDVDRETHLEVGEKYYNDFVDKMETFLLISSKSLQDLSMRTTHPFNNKLPHCILISNPVSIGPS